MTLFDPQVVAAVAVTNGAIAQAAGGADPRWLALAMDAVRATAATMPRFTTDDIAKRCALTPREPRAWGAVMRRAQAEGIVRATGQYRASAEIACHRRPKMVWEPAVQDAVSAPQQAAGRVLAAG